MQGQLSQTFLWGIEEFGLLFILPIDLELLSNSIYTYLSVDFGTENLLGLRKACFRYSKYS